MPSPHFILYFTSLALHAAIYSVDLIVAQPVSLQLQKKIAFVYVTNREWLCWHKRPSIHDVHQFLVILGPLPSFIHVCQS